MLTVVAFILLIDVCLLYLVHATGLPLTIAVSLIAVFTIVTGFCVYCLKRLNSRAARARRRPDHGNVILIKNDDSTSLVPSTFAKERATPPVRDRQAQASRLTSVREPEHASGGSMNESTREEEVAEEPTITQPAQAAPMRTAQDDAPTAGRKTVTPIFSIPDILEEVYAHGRMISSLITRYKQRLEGLEALLGDIHSSRGAEVSLRLVNARRVLGALEVRLERLKTFTRNHSSPDLLKAKALAQKPLVIPKDALHALLGSEDLPELAPQEWEPKLDELLNGAESLLRKQKRIQNW